MLTPPKPSPPITRHKQHVVQTNLVPPPPPPPPPSLPSLQHDPSHQQQQQPLEEPPEQLPAKENLDQPHELPDQHDQQQIQPNDDVHVDVQSTQKEEQQDNAKEEKQSNVEEEQNNSVEEKQHDNIDNPAKKLHQEDPKIEAIDPKVEESNEECNDTQPVAIDPKAEESGGRNDTHPTKAGGEGMLWAWIGFAW